MAADSGRPVAGSVAVDARHQPVSLRRARAAGRLDRLCDCAVSEAEGLFGSRHRGQRTVLALR